MPQVGIYNQLVFLVSLNSIDDILANFRSKSRQNAVSFLPAESLKWTEIILSCLLTTLKKAHDEDILLAGIQSIMVWQLFELTSK